MTHEELLKSTVQYGFAVAVAAFVLVRMEARLVQLADAITALRTCMEVKTAKFEEAIRRCEQRDMERDRG